MKSSSIGRVVLWMTGELVSFSALALSVRALSRTLSVFEILSLRLLLGLLILFAIAGVNPALRAGLRSRRMRLNLVRNAIHFAGQYFWALGITLLPLAMVFAIEFTMPAWVALLALAFLSERLSAGRIAVIVLGFLGVLIIVRPGLEGFRLGSLVVLAAALAFAVSNILVKRLTTTEDAFGIVFWMTAMQLPMALVASDPLFAFKLGASDIPAIVAVSVSGLAAHYCLAQAFRAGDAMIVIPLDYLRLPLIAVVAWLFLGEALDPYVFVGAAIMIAGILWNLHSEARGR